MSARKTSGSYCGPVPKWTPSLADRKAAARPIPRDPPVTKIVSPANVTIAVRFPTLGLVDHRKYDGPHVATNVCRRCSLD